jgi:CheY-like chemotaxis protein
LDPETRAVVEGLFDFVISKPISIAELLRVLTSERRSKPREPTEIKPKVLDRTMQPRVLVAEDNATNQMVISAMLEKLGCRVNVVADGAEALRAVQTLPYDIVLMDIMMPVMDGVEATRAIRALPSPIARVPILGLTAHASPEDHESFRRCGMNDVMSKPVTKQVLEANLAANLV